jgi:hypothetical protein
MGNKTSTVVQPTPVPSKIVAQQTPQPIQLSQPVTNTTCAVKQQQYNQLQIDLTQKQAELNICNAPALLQSRITAATAENSTYINTINSKIAELQSEFSEKTNIADKLSVSVNKLTDVLQELENQESSVSDESRNIEQLERKERRQFLDNGPQDKLNGLLGVRTTDDKILLAFWITFGIAIIVSSLLITIQFPHIIGGSEWKHKIIFISVLLFVGYSMAYYGIVNYA